MKEHIRRYIPDSQQLRKTRSLGWLGTLLHHPHLWHLNRRSVANGIAVGLFSMWLPVPIQMVIAALLAIPCRANLPLSVVIVWITNPVTAPPMFYGAYLFGAWVLQREPQMVDFSVSIDWLTQSLTQIWQPFLLGCLLLGIISAALGYVTVGVVWRIYIFRSMKKRNRQFKK